MKLRATSRTPLGLAGRVEEMRHPEREAAVGTAGEIHVTAAQHQRRSTMSPM